VGGVVLDGDGRVLLIRRGKPPLKGRWVVPGGHVEWGETLEAAVVREIREETGLDVLPHGQIAVVEIIAPDHHFVIVDYLCAVVGGRVVAGSDAMAAAFHPLASMGELDVPPKAQEVILQGADLWRQKGLASPGKEA
jgi:ADP-ribose pyrophosphatase YjhB (NUDIX family)